MRSRTATDLDLAPYDINALIYRKEQLLEPWPPQKAAV